MSDNKNNRGARDRARVSSSEEYELRYLAEKLNVSQEEVRNAIEKVGNSRDKVEEYLRKSGRR